MNGTHIVVTGGRGALGRVVVEVLAARGATVHVADLPDVNLTDEASTAALFRGLPPIWASVHLAGGYAMAPLVDISLADFEAQWRLNTVTCFLSCREAVRSMRQGPGGGRIVNVAARPALVPTGGMTSYVAAKAGVAAITQALAAELKSDRILVNAVVPSVIDTPANRASMPTADHAAWPTPRQIAQAIEFLVSPDNALTSGALVPVYGRA